MIQDQLINNEYIYKINNLIILSNNRIEVLNILEKVVEKSIKDAKETIYTFGYIKGIRLNIIYEIMREIYQNGYTPDIEKIENFINTDFALVLIEKDLLHNNLYKLNIINDLIIVDSGVLVEKLKKEFKNNFVSICDKIEKQVKRITNGNNDYHELIYVYKILKENTMHKGFIKRMHEKLHRKLTTRELMVLKHLEDSAIFLTERDFL